MTAFDKNGRPIRIGTWRMKRRGSRVGPTWYLIQRFEPYGVLKVGWRKASHKIRTRAEAEDLLAEMAVRVTTGRTT